MLPIIIAAMANDHGFGLNQGGFPLDRAGLIALGCASVFLVIAGAVVLVIG